MNTQANAMPESPLESQVAAAGGLSRRARAPVLVGAARIVGEPFDLHCAAGGRRCRSVRLLSQLDCGYLGKAAEAQSGATSSAIRHGGRSDDAYRHRRECVLLSRRVARRAPRSQHSVLEVAAGFRSHHRACEGEHSAGRSAAADRCDHRRHAVDHAAVEQRGRCWRAV